MARALLYPFARLDEQDVYFADPTFCMDAEAVSPSVLTDVWDANSEIEVTVSAQVNGASLATVCGEGARLTLSVSCQSTALTASRSTAFELGEKTGSATVRVSVSGADIAEELSVKALIEAPHMGSSGPSGWLSRKIVAEIAPVTVPLRSDLSVFPTESRSFSEMSWLDAPWRIRIDALGLSDHFAPSIRLSLNEDHAVAKSLMKGEAKGTSLASLEASLARVILSAARNACDELSDGTTPDAVAEEFPDSLAAAARRVSTERLDINLGYAIDLQRNRPDEFEFRMAAAFEPTKRGKR